MNESRIDREDPYGRHGGDLQGIIDNLDFIDEMGYTALWLNPVLENNQPQSSYHGYAITDYYKVDPRFGDNELYLELSEKASDKGIKLIMDMIFNHCGSEHWWMDDLPSADWINYYPDFKITNHKRTVNQDMYASQTDTELMTRGWFVETMPDLNQHNPLLKNYLIQNSIWWIEYLGLGGIRMDTYPYPEKEMMAEWCERVLYEYPNFNIVGEEWSENPVIVSYWQKGKKNHDGYRPQLPSVMDFPLQTALASALTEEENWGSGLVKLYEALAMDFLYPNPHNITIFPDNHDMPRFYMQVGMDRALFNLGIAYILTMRGIPQIYYGTEILMDHTEGDGHGYIRKDFPGGWEGDERNAFTGENMTEEALETQEMFKTLLNWRKNKEVIHKGDILHFGPADNVYVYFRYTEDEKVMVIINKNREEYTLDLNRFDEILEGAEEGREVLSGMKTDLGKGELDLQAMIPYIIEF
jgi:glycosidase